MEKKKQVKKHTGDWDGNKEEIKNPAKKGYRKGCFGDGENHCEIRNDRYNNKIPEIKEGKKRRKMFAYNLLKKVSNNYYINKRKHV